MNKRGGDGRTSAKLASVCATFFVLSACSEPLKNPNYTSMTHIYDVLERDICSADSLKLSPSGKYFQASIGRPSISVSPLGSPRFYVGNVKCLIDHQSNCVKSIEDVNGVKFFAWKTDDNFISISKLGSIINYKLIVDGKKAISISSKLVGSLSLEHAYIIQQSSINGVYTGKTSLGITSNYISRLGDAQLHYIPLWVRYSGGLGPTVLLSNKENLSTLIVQSSEKARSDAVSSYFTVPLLSSNGSGRTVLTDYGMLRGAIRPFWFPYQAGSVGNILDGKSISSGLRKYDLSIDRVFPYAKNNASYVINWMSKENKSNIVSVDDLYGNRIIAFSSPWGTRRIICSAGSQLHGVDRRAELFLMSKNSDVVPGIRVRAVANRISKKGVAMFFVGGPAGDILPIKNHGLASIYLEEGLDVIFVAYSGVKGVGLSRGEHLSKDPAGALRRDAGIVAATLNREYNDKVPVFVHGESFGAAAGSFLNQAISHRKGALIGIAPYLRPKDPNYTIRNGEIGGENSEYQARWEQAILGFKGSAERLKFHQAIIRSLRLGLGSRPMIFIFGSNDVLSGEDDLPQEIRSRAYIMKVNGDHASAFINSDVRKFLKNYIGKAILR